MAVGFVQLQGDAGMKRGRESWSRRWARRTGDRGTRRRRGFQRRSPFVEALERRELLAADFPTAWAGGGEAVAAGQPTRPEIVVTLGSEEILDGRTSPPVSFGEVFRYQSSPQLTFLVQNTGTGVLTLGSVQVPSGYCVVEPLALNLAPYESDSFTVDLTGCAGT